MLSLCPPNKAMVLTCYYGFLETELYNNADSLQCHEVHTNFHGNWSLGMKVDRNACRDLLYLVIVFLYFLGVAHGRKCRWC